MTAKKFDVIGLGALNYDYIVPMDESVREARLDPSSRAAFRGELLNS